MPCACLGLKTTSTRYRSGLFVSQALQVTTQHPDGTRTSTTLQLEHETASPMKIIFAGPSARHLSSVIPDHEATFIEDRLESLGEGVLAAHDLLISFGYRHRISQESLEILNGQAVNIHVSLLPWNRGAHPNFWSWATNTPKGVTVHWIDTGLDTGPILDQQAVHLSPDSTLRETHETLLQAGVKLLSEAWVPLRDGASREQELGGSFHRQAELEDHVRVLTNGWDTTCRKVMEYGQDRGLWVNLSSQCHPIDRRHAEPPPRR